MSLPKSSYLSPPNIQQEIITDFISHVNKIPYSDTLFILPDDLQNVLKILILFNRKEGSC